jgi:gliding motility-associated-like protein
MCNFTLRKFNSIKLFTFILFLMISYNASAQFYTKHYIAPAPWQYFSKANEIVIATNSTTTVNITVSKSDGTVVTTLTASKGTPAIYRFAGKPSAAPAFAFNTVLNAAGLIVTGNAPISINLRNVASDALGGDGSDQDIKGNAALTSFGDAGIGIRFRVGYYRDGSLGNFNNYGDQRPIYSVMAITNGTTVTIGGVVTATLNTGQSYLFKAAIGTLVETSNPSVMNTSAFIDTPNGCGDGAFNQIPPEAVLGSEYFIERGKGNDTAEQTTVIATKPNTKVIVDTYSVTGALVSTKTTTLATAGSFFTFLNGVSGANFSASRVSADNNVVVYSGTAQSCEVDISTIAPVSECGGSKFIETAKFRNYGTGSLPYFGYVLLKDAVSKVYVNSVDIETKSGVSPRHQLGTTGWYLINFEDTQIGSPDVLSISSDAKLTVSIVQQGGGFSMAGFFSNFAVQPEDPTFSYISGGGCTNSSALLSTPSGFTPYQWYYNGTAITGANSNTYTATKTGSYSVASTLTCGAQTQSKPVTVTLCTDLGITKTVDKATPCVGSNVEFTLTLSNLGVNNATGVSVNDLLPTGYSFVSSTPSVGTYNSGTGVWSIGDINAGIAVTLKIVAKVNANGVYTNTAIIPASVSDTNSANNSASASTTPNPLPTVIVTNPASVCAPSKVDITVPAITTGSTANLTFSYWTDAAATITYSTPTAATAGTYYIKGTTASGCSDIKPVVVTTAMAPNAGTLSGTQNICISGTTTFTSNGNSGGSWASSDTAVATVNAQSGLITGIAAGTATITYKVTGTGGCNDANATRNITVNPTPTASVTGVLTSCYNTTLTAVTNTSPAAYVWYKDNLVISGQTASTLAVTADGDYKVKVTNTTTTCENTSAASTVKVSDTQKPTITCPSNVTAVADANSCVATGIVLGAPTTTDNCTGTTVTNNAPSSFPIGVTTVTWTAKDVSGNTQTCTQTVTVSDTQKPTITCPSNVTTVADANSCVATGIVLGAPTTTDNCTGTITVTNNAPSSFPIGITTVTWTAKDVSGNIQTCTQSVTVSDTQKPTITCPSNVTAVADANSCVATGIVLGTPTTTDNCTGTITVTNNASSSFPIGVTTVTWTAKDVSGNTQTCTQTVTVSDTQKPTIICPSNVTAVADANSCVATGVILGTPTTTDNCTGTITVTNNAPSSFPIGVTTVTWTAKDVSGNTQTCTQTVKVVGPIKANDDTVSSFNGFSGGVAVSNVLSNDLLNCSAVVTSDVNVTLASSLPSVLNFNITNGSVEVKPQTPAGTYSFDYTICEKSNTTNCSTASVKITVVAPVIDAVTETTTSINGNTGGTTTESLITNDTLNGNPVVIGTNPGEVKLTGITVPTGLTLNANGTVTVAANTAAGNYNLEYSICEITNPTNCDTVTSVVVVGKPAIDAVTETTTSINGNKGGTTASLTANDTLNGNPVVIGTNPGEVKLTGITVPTGLTLNANGTVTVPANTAAGNYNVEYSICEITNPTNCDTVTSVVVVGKPTIDAVTETTTSINGNTGGTTASLTANDTLNGNPVVIGTNPGEVKLTGITVPTGLTLNANGTVTVAANTAAGNYNVEYSICEITNPTNCDTVTSVVVVGKPTIDAVTETTTSINGNTGGTTTESLITNDTLNGNPVVIGTNPGEVKLTGITIPTGLTLNANGTVTVAANTPANDYEIEYSICEITNPTNCDVVKSIITVTGGILIANPDAVASVVATNLPQTVANVFDNDTSNGIAVVPSDLNLTIVTADPKGMLTLNPDGTITLEANAPSGTYEILYQICEKLNPANCSSASVKVTVGTPIINAVEETTTTVVNGVVGGTTESLVANDTLNGSPVVIGTKPGNVKLSEVMLPTGFVLNADGTVTVPANTPAGNYNVEYKICEINNPTNCDSATSIIVVTGGVLIANPDAVASVVATNQPQTVANVFDNDTNNGIAVVSSDLNLTIVTADPKGMLTLNPDGTITLEANAPSGTYEIVYQICEKLNPANCSSASVKVTVGTPIINAVEETTTTVVNGVVGGTTESLIANDTLNGSPVVIGTKPGNVTLSEVTLPAGFILNADGTVTVPANTPAGNYNLEYKICEINNPTNCDSATSIIVVTGDGLQANPDVIPSLVESKLPQVLVNVFDNDTNNGITVVPSDLNLTIVTADPTGFLMLNNDGTVTLGANAPAGTYELTYKICEKLDPKNCSQAIVRVKVNAVMPVTPATPIVANNDGEVLVDGINGQLAFINILDNDLLSGLPLNASDVVISNTPNPYFEFNADGTINVLPNTPGGNYALVYQICQKANSSNCATATLNVFVEVPAIAIIKTAVFNDENKDGYANAGETITYKFKITNTGNVPLMKILVTDLLPGIILSGDAIDLDVNESDENNFTAIYKISKADINAGSVSNQASVQGKSATDIVVEDKSDDSNNLEDKPTVLPLNGCQITILNAFSPNGDNKNERFYIRGLECYPDNTVEIYNRWGVLVFDIDHYNNEDRAFVGYSAGRTTMKQSEGLPVGTYFYILKYRDSESNQHEKSGYLYINK